MVPIIEKISKNLDTIISIDTYKYDVAKEAIVGAKYNKMIFGAYNMTMEKWQN